MFPFKKLIYSLAIPDEAPIYPAFAAKWLGKDSFCVQDTLPDPTQKVPCWISLNYNNTLHPNSYVTITRRGEVIYSGIDIRNTISAPVDIYVGDMLTVNIGILDPSGTYNIGGGFFVSAEGVGELIREYESYQEPNLHLVGTFVVPATTQLLISQS